MDELISRQAAIKAIEAEKISHGRYLTSSYAGYEFAKDVIRKLPPIQPVIVRCKECRHRYVEGDNVRYNTCELNHNNVQSDEWFCADAERREVTT